MPQSETTRKWREEKKKSGDLTQVVIECDKGTKAEWKAYAAFRGLPLATLIRQHMAAAMAADGWTYSEPEGSKEPGEQE